jgi:hypothetical protein
LAVLPLEDRVAPATFPALQPAHPLGSLICTGSHSATFATADETDPYTIGVAPGQTLAALFTPQDPSLRARMTLQSGGTTLQTVSATAAGQSLLIPATTLAGGTYEIDVENSAGGSGQYTLQLVLNAAAPDPNHPNHGAATAEDISASSVALQGTADRLGAVGRTDAAGDPDFYRFQLSQGQPTTLALHADTAGNGLELWRLNGDGSTTLVTIAIAPPMSSGAPSPLNEVITDFIPQASGTYLAEVTGGAGQNYGLLVARGAGFDSPDTNAQNDTTDLGNTDQALSHFPPVLPITTESGNNTGLSTADDLSGTFQPIGTPNTYQATVSGNSNGQSHDFHILASPGDTLTVNELDSSLNYRYLYLYDRAGNSLASAYSYSWSNPAHPQLTYTFGSHAYAGDYYIEFYGYSGKFQLTATLNSPAPLLCEVYSFPASANDQLSITTATPGNAGGATDAQGKPLQPVNTFTPIIDLIDPTGAVVMTNQRGAADGHNARISYQATVAGTYTVAVRSADLLPGDFSVAVTGSTAAGSQPPTVTAVHPPDTSANPVGAGLRKPPTALDVTFSEGILTTSVNPSLITIDGGAVVNSAELLDGRTARFGVTVPDSPLGTDKTYTYTLSAGAVTDLQNEANAAFTGSFFIDHTGPHVVSQSASTVNGSADQGPVARATFTFDEALDPATVNRSAVTSFADADGNDLSGRIVNVFLWPDGKTVEVDFYPHPAAPGTYTLRLGTAIADLAGNPVDQDQDGDATPDDRDSYTATFAVAGSPDLVAVQVSVDNPTGLLQAGQASVSWTVANHGAAPTDNGWWSDGVYLSRSPNFDPSKVVYGASTDPTAIRHLSDFYHSGNLGAQPAAGDDSTNSYVLTGRAVAIPSDAPTGPQYLLVVANQLGYQAESDFSGGTDANNVQAVPVTISTPNVDLVVTGQSGITSGGNVTAGNSLNSSYTVANHGAAATTTTYWYDAVYLSTTPNYDPTNNPIFLTDVYHNGTLGAEPTSGVDDSTNSYTRNLSAYIPSTVTPGSYYVLIVADHYKYQPETDQSNDTNDVLAVPVTVQNADLVVTAVSATPASGNVGDTFAVTYTVHNQGDAATSRSWYDAVYISHTQQLDDYAENWLGYIWRGSNQTALDAQGGAHDSYTATVNVTVQDWVNGGNYYFVVQTNLWEYQPESKYDNDVGATSGTFNLAAPDLALTNASASQSATVGETIPVTYTVTNLNSVAATAQSGDAIFLSHSTTFTYDSPTTWIGRQYEGRALGASGSGTESYNGSTSVTIPANWDTSQPSYLYVVANYDEYQGESDGEWWASDGTWYKDANNISPAMPIKLSAPDLAVSNVTAPASAAWTQSIPVTFTVSDISSVPALGSWQDYVYLSRTTTFDSAALYLGQFWHGSDAPLDASGGAHDHYTATVNFTIPSDLGTGPFYLFVVTNQYRYQGESDYSNGTDANDISDPVPLTINLPNVDLVVTGQSGITSGGNVVASSQLNFSYTVANHGAMATTVSSWYDSVYLSTTAKYDPANNPTLLMEEGHYGTLGPQPAGGVDDSTNSYTQALSANIPWNTTPGSYYVLIVTNRYKNEPEIDQVNDTNDVLAVPVTITPPNVDLVVTGQSGITSGGNVLAGGSYQSFSYTVANHGTTATFRGWWDEVFLSTTPNYDPTNNPTYLTETYNYGTLGPEPASGVDDSTNSYTRSTSFYIPSNATLGSAYILIVANNGHNQPETDQANDTNDVLAVPVRVVGVDLVVKSLSVAPASGGLGDTFALTYTVQNLGNIATNTGWYDWIYLSDTPDMWSSPPYLTYFWQGSPNTPLDAQGGAHDSYTVTENVTVPNSSKGGNRYFLVETNYYYNSGTHWQQETNYNNDLAAVPVSIAAPDLAVSNASVSQSSAVGATATVTYTVTNLVPVAATQTLTDVVYLSHYTTFYPYYAGQSDEPQIGSQNYGPVGAGGSGTESYNGSVNVTIPVGWDASQPSYVYVAANYNHRQGEIDGATGSDANNVSAAVPITIDAPDLVVTSISDSAPTAKPGDTLSVSWTVQNQGDVSATASWDDYIFLSTDPVYGQGYEYQVGDRWTQAGWGTHDTPLDPYGGSHDHYDTSATVTVPSWLSPGTYYVHVVSNSSYYGAHNQGETRYDNNASTAVISLAVGAPDLAVPAVSDNGATTVPVSGTLPVSWTVQNVGSAASGAPSWSDQVYLSTDPVYGRGSEYLIGSRTTQSGDLPLTAQGGAHDHYNASLNATVPSDLSPGTYYLHVLTNPYIYSAQYGGYVRLQSETNYNNDASTASIPIAVTVPDIIVPAVSGLTSITLVNNGFETPDLGRGGQAFSYPPLDAGWTFTGGAGIAANGSNFNVQNAANGNYGGTRSTSGQAGFIQTPDAGAVSSISQTLSGFVAGTVTVTFSIEQRMTGSTVGGNNPINVKLDDQDLGTYLATSSSNFNTITTPPVTVTAGSHTLYFIGTDQTGGDNTQFIDNVRVTNVPTAPAMTVPLGGTLPVTWTVQDVSSSPTGALSWVDYVYLSTDPVYGKGQDYWLGQRATQSGDLPLTAQGGAHDRYNAGANFTVPTWLAPGTYYLHVYADGSNAQGVTTPSDKISTATIPITVVLSAPDLTVPAVSDSGTSSVPLGGQLPVSWTVQNAGASPSWAGAWYDQVYLSTDPVYGKGTDYALGPRWTQTGDLPLTAQGGAHDHYDASLNVTIPDSFAPGTYYLHVYADAGNSQAVTNPGDKVSIATIPISVTGPDLVISAVSDNGVTSVPSSGTLPVSWTVRNVGISPSVIPSWDDEIYLSTDPVFGKGTDYRVGSRTTQSGDLPLDAPALGGAHDHYDASLNVAIPSGLAAGTYYLHVYADVGNVQGVTNPGDKVSTATIPITVTVPDLVVSAVSDSGVASVSLGGALPVTWTVQDVSTSPTGAPSWVDYVYLSTDPVYGRGTDTVIGTRHTQDGDLPLTARGGAHDHYDAGLALTVPTSLAPGTYYLHVYADAGNAQGVINRGDKVSTVSIPVTVTAPDLRVANLTVDPNTPLISGRYITLHWTDENTGSGPTAAPLGWGDRVLITNTDLNRTALSTVAFYDVHAAGNGNIAANDSRNRQLSVRLPDGALGAGHLTIAVTTDFYGNVPEYNGAGTGETNNTTNLAAVSALAAYPDLQVTGLTATPATGLQSGDSLVLSWNDNNTGNGPTTGPFYDHLTVVNTTTGAVLPGADLYYDPTAAGNGAIAANDSRARQLVYTLPQGDAGTGDLQLTVTTDYYNQAFEYNAAGPGGASTAEGNNSASLTTTVTLAPYPDLAVSGVTAPSQVIGDPARVMVSWTVTNLGTGPTAADTWTDAVIASPDDNPAHGTVLAQFTHQGALAAGDSYTQSQAILTPPGFTGRYHLFVRTDTTGAVFENGMLANNEAEAPNVSDIMPIPYADLVVSGVTAPDVGASGQPLQLSWTVTNQGIATTNIEGWGDQVSLATDPAGNHIVAWLGSFDHIGYLAVGGSYTRTVTTNPLPNGIHGTYYVVVQTSGPFEFLYKSNDTAVSGPVSVTFTPPPDLTVTGLSTPTTQAQGGDAIDVTWGVQNVGPGDANGAWVDSVHLKQVGGSLNFDLGDFTYATPLPAGQSYTRTEHLQLPVYFPYTHQRLQGMFQLVVSTNVGYYPIFENGATANNTLVDPDAITLTVPPSPDLQVQSVEAPSTGQAGATVSLNFTVINQGPAVARGHWTDNVYVSLVDHFDGSAVWLGTFDNPLALGTGESYQTQTGALKLPERLSGPAYLIVQTNANGAVEEFPGAYDNTFVSPIAITPVPPADLLTGNVAAPDQAWSGAPISVSYHVADLGLGPTDVSSWVDTVWLTRDRTRPDPTKGDVLLATLPHSGLLGNDPTVLTPPTGYDQTATITLPRHISGQYFLTAWADSYDAVLKNTLDANINPDDPNELNSDNYKARPITLLLAPPPDLAVTAVTAQPTAVGGDSFTVQWTVQNQGANPTEDAVWYDHVWLTDTPTLNASGGGQG